MPSFSSLGSRACAYWCLVVALGVAAAAASVHSLHGQDPIKVILLAAIALAVAGFKIRLPGILGTLSLNYVIILVALLTCNLGTGMIVALIGTLGQCLIHTKVWPRWFQVVFSVAAIALPVLAANTALHSRFLEETDPTGCLGLLAASLAYFLMNTVSVAGMISLSTVTNLLDVWTTSYLWTSPQYLVGGAIAWVVHFFDHRFGFAAVLIAFPPLYLLYRSYTTYLGRIQEQQDHLGEMAALHLRTIETLALAIDAKDDTTAAHLRRVQIYASEIGKELKLPAPEMQALNAAALLHDVGKLAVPEYIISKPGRLTPEEFEKMKVHPVVGAEILERVNFPYPVVPIVRSHHEKFDGTGYPDGLSGTQIPIGARILSVVDCLDALASDRQYRQALPLDEAMAIVASESGKAFDPQVVSILQRRHKELEQLAKDQTSEQIRLSTNIRVERGLAPATGFASASDYNTSDLRAEGDFGKSIATARQEIHVLTEVMNDLGNSLSLDDTLALLASRLQSAVAHDAVAVYLIRNDKLIPRFVQGESCRLFSSLEIPVGQGLSGWVAENNKPIVNANPVVETGYLNDPSRVTSLRSAIAIPLYSNDHMVGVLTLYSLRRDAFNADHNRLLLAIAAKAAHAIENSVRFERARNAADTDELTGLANSRYLFSHLASHTARSARSGDGFAVLMMDLDGFKQANDRYGHLAGNRILKEVAKHLRMNTRAGDVVARVGGDEFVVIMNQATEKVTDYIARIEQITARLANEVQCDVSIGISVGVARYPEDGTDSRELLQRADEHMYEVKRAKYACNGVNRTAVLRTEELAVATPYLN